MSDNFEQENKGFLENQVSEVISELCLQNDSDFIEADIVALFEDIKQFFSGRDEEFIDFDDLPEEAKKAIYTEIKNIILLLKQLKKGADKQLVMQMLSKNLSANLSSHAEKFKSASEQLAKKEREDLKRRFADATLLELYKERQIYLALNKAPPQKLMNDIETYIEKMRQAPAPEYKTHATSAMRKKPTISKKKGPQAAPLRHL